VAGDVLGHTESTDLVFAENLSHLLVWFEVLFVFWILKIVFLDVSPQLFDAFGSGGFLLANDVGELGAQLHGFG